MNSIQNTIKQLRMLNIKTALKTISECQPKSVNLYKPNNELVNKSKLLSLTPRNISVEILYKPTSRPTETIKQQDPIPYIPIVNPRSILPLLDKEWVKDEIGLPAIQQEEIRAERLIVIRRKKMKKHQRRKLYKKMKFRWAKVKQHRRQKKEKIFQNSLLALVKSANEFRAEDYVSNKLEKANYTPLPAHLRNRNLPDFIIRQKLGIDKKVNFKHTDVYKA